MAQLETLDAQNKTKLKECIESLNFRDIVPLTNVIMIFHSIFNNRILMLIFFN